MPEAPWELQPAGSAGAGKCLPGKVSPVFAASEQTDGSRSYSRSGTVAASCTAQLTSCPITCKPGAVEEAERAAQPPEERSYWEKGWHLAKSPNKWQSKSLTPLFRLFFFSCCSASGFQLYPQQGQPVELQLWHSVAGDGWI